jgi:hypothetical protein
MITKIRTKNDSGKLIIFLKWLQNHFSSKRFNGFFILFNTYCDQMDQKYFLTGQLRYTFDILIKY